MSEDQSEEAKILGDKRAHNQKLFRHCGYG